MMIRASIASRDFDFVYGELLAFPHQIDCGIHLVSPYIVVDNMLAKRHRETEPEEYLPSARQMTFLSNDDPAQQPRHTECPRARHLFRGTRESRDLGPARPNQH